MKNWRKGLSLLAVHFEVCWFPGFCVCVCVFCCFWCSYIGSIDECLTPVILISHTHCKPPENDDAKSRFLYELVSPICVCVCPCSYPCLFPSNLPCEPHSLASNRTLSFPWGCGCSSWLCNRHPYLCNLGKVSGSRSLPGPPGPHRSDSNPLGNLSSSPSVGIHHSTSWWNRCRVHCAGVSRCWALAGSSEIITWNEKAWSFILLSNPAAQFKNHCDLCIYIYLYLSIYICPQEDFSAV